jgi:hypothetical protein
LRQLPAALRKPVAQQHQRPGACFGKMDFDAVGLDKSINDLHRELAFHQMFSQKLPPPCGRNI